MRKSFLTARWLVGLIVGAALLTACAKRPPAPAIAFASPTPITGATRTPVPMVTSTRPPTLTFTPTANRATQIHLMVTYVPSRTPRPTATRSTPTATFLPTSTFMPSLTPATPLGPEAYGLKNWTEEEALAAVAEADGFVVKLSYSNSSLYDITDFHTYRRILEQEALNRFPELAYEADLIWKLGLQEANPYLGLPYSLRKYFLPALEAKLNAGKIKNCSSVAQDLMVVAYTADNLFGDGMQAMVCVFSVNGVEAAVVIRNDSSGDYQVASLEESWSFIWRGYREISIVDRNGNGQPEIQDITTRTGSMGMSCASEFGLYEWQGKYTDGHFVNLAEKIEGVSENWGEGCTDNWEFASAISSSQNITSMAPLYVTGVNCQNYELRTTYEWDGTIYQTANQQSNILDEKTSLACAVGWADWAGWQNEQAVTALTTAIGEWPGELDKTWGPAAQDYFRFKLGTWYALRGDDDMARKTLEAVRDHPSNTQYAMASRLARAFLARYTAGYSFEACRTAVTLLSDRSVTDEAQWYQQDAFRKAWGFSAPYWNFNPYNVCKPADFLPQAVQTFRPRATSDLYAWFRDQHIPVWTIAQADVNADGLNDWVAVVKTLPYTWELWAFLQTESGLNAVLIEPRYYVRATYFATLVTSPSDVRLHLFQLGEITTAFRLVLKDGAWQAAEVETAYRSTTPKPSTPTQHERIKQVETMFFDTGDIAGAQRELQSLLAGHIVEPDYYADSLPRIRPRLLYLLGLTYELSGDEANAVQTYWQLWHDYPGNPYTFIARRKLELKP